MLGWRRPNACSYLGKLVSRDVGCDIAVAISSKGTPGTRSCVCEDGSSQTSEDGRAEWNSCNVAEGYIKSDSVLTAIESINSFGLYRSMYCWLVSLRGGYWSNCHRRSGNCPFAAATLLLSLPALLLSLLVLLSPAIMLLPVPTLLLPRSCCY